MDLVSVIVAVVVLALAFWVVGQLKGMLPPPIVTVLHVVLVVIFVLYLLRWFGLVAGGPLRVGG